MFDDRPIVSEPAVFCAIGGAGEVSGGGHHAADCSCFTEQGTPYFRISCLTMRAVAAIHDAGMLLDGVSPTTRESNPFNKAGCRLVQ